MAEEDRAAEEVAETERTPDEGEQEQEQQQEAEPVTVEALATDLGWRPRDQFKGPVEDWKPADEYIRASKPIADNLHREIRSMRDQIERVTRTSAQIMEDTLAQRLAERDAYWARVQAKGVEDGKQDVVDKAVEERIKLAAERDKPKADSGPTMPPETQAFVERNKGWFDVDPLATMRAQEVCDQLAKRGVPVAEQLSQAERAIRKEFPEHFTPPAKPPASTQTSQSRSTSQGSRRKGFADMPKEAQDMAQDFLKRHGVPLEKTAESYWQDQSSSRRVA